MNEGSLRPARRWSGRARWIGSAGVALMLLAGGPIMAPTPANAAPVAPSEVTVAPPMATSITTSGATLNIRPANPSWTLTVKVDKAVDAGTLQIADQFSDVVRTIEVAASADGTVTTSWDGQDDTQTTVPESADYTWVLDMQGSDGSGALVAQDGSSPVTGTVRVVDESLGTMKGATPTISDTTPVVGQLLKAVPGKWTPSTGIEYSYQWYRDSAEIAFADGATYTVTPADAGHRLKVKVSGVVQGWDDDPVERVSAATSTVSKGVLSTSATPRITGTATVDQTLTVDPGTWGPGTVDLAYQWYTVTSKGKAKALSGATASTYVVGAAAAGLKLKVRVTGSESGYTGRSVDSKTTGKVAKARFTSAGTPTITVAGTLLVVGETLTAEPGTYAPAATGNTYQWYRVKGTKKTAIKKATKKTYVVTSSDKGYAITVAVAGTRAGYTNSATVFAATPSPVAVAGITSVTPKLSDTTPVVDQVLSVTSTTGASTWGPAGVDVAYAWYAGTTLVGTGSTYQVTAADVGKTIKVALTGSLDDYPSVTKTSKASSKVAKASFDADAMALYIEHSDFLPGVLEASVSGPVTPDDIQWQWYSVVGKKATAISGATESSLAYTDADGKYQVRATLVKAGYNSLVLTGVKDLAQG
ncbi:MAG: FlgD immunoglobulin-like domain containing protein [Propionicimonas sp.]|uniref:FlgD immunoglobulin-like domain containing protein n=1 Tax=Propionicimonas sp. TaxID=1955623 RepID=UPI003D0F2729